MKKSEISLPPPDVDSLILTVREQKVILDSDLARIYGVPTFRFNESVKRNLRRFPPDFRFQVTAEEWSAIQALEPQPALANPTSGPHSSQFAMSSARHRGAAYRPWAFTEHGALMVANLLNSPRAVEMSIHVIRAFVALRREAGRYEALGQKLAELERTQKLHGDDLQMIFDALRQLEETTSWPYPEGRRLIGFRVAPEAKTKPLAPAKK
jgi:hypothetical protein